ncbi:MAG: hypothetical protein ACHRXM_26170 [Isosphaerales bacterium]
MRAMLIGLLLLVSSLRADEPAKHQTPKKRYDEFVQEYKVAEEGALAARREAKTAEEGQKALARYPRIEEYGPRFLELAKEYPADPVACDALVWVIEHGYSGFDASPYDVARVPESLRAGEAKEDSPVL